MESWFESFVHFQANYADNIEATAFFFEHEFDYLQLNWHINDLWLFDSNSDLIFSTSKTENDYIYYCGCTLCSCHIFDDPTISPPPDFSGGTATSFSSKKV
jgi:hypothetical protein